MMFLEGKMSWRVCRRQLGARRLCRARWEDTEGGRGYGGMRYAMYRLFY